MHWASANGNKEIVELLLANGANVNVQDKVRSFYRSCEVLVVVRCMLSHSEGAVLVRRLLVALLAALLPISSFLSSAIESAISSRPLASLAVA